MGRTLASADYVVVGDTIAGVTGMATEAKQDTAKTVIDIIAADTTTDIPATITALKAVADLIEDIARNRIDITDATGAVSLKNDAGVEMLTASVTDNATTTTRTRLV